MIDQGQARLQAVWAYRVKLPGVAERYRRYKYRHVPFPCSRTRKLAVGRGWKRRAALGHKYALDRCALRAVGRHALPVLKMSPRRIYGRAIFESQLTFRSKSL